MAETTPTTFIRNSEEVNSESSLNDCSVVRRSSCKGAIPPIWDFTAKHQVIRMEESPLLDRNSFRSPPSPAGMHQTRILLCVVAQNTHVEHCPMLPIVPGPPPEGVPKGRVPLQHPTSPHPHPRILKTTEVGGEDGGDLISVEKKSRGSLPASSASRVPKSEGNGCATTIQRANLSSGK